MAGMFQDNYTGEYDDSADKFTEQLIGLWEAAEMDSFKKAVDGSFDLLGVVSKAGYQQAEFEAQEQKDKDSVVKKLEKRDLVEDIFKTGGCRPGSRQLYIQRHVPERWKPAGGPGFIVIQEISKEYQQQKSNQHSPMDGSARKH